MKRRFVVGLALLLGACGDDGADDGGADAGSRCAGDVDCTDGLYCNGAERCAPSNPAADARGCLPGPAPCEGLECDEASTSCVEGCVDGDGDGYRAIACGGDDCDDTDPARNPGEVEVCDAADLDEDCDPSTFGKDDDDDGFEDLRCCNFDPASGATACGRDCNDDLAGVNPTAVDGCGGGDEDCDGTVDNVPDERWYRDRDTDGWGDDADMILSCSRVDGYVLDPGDCVDDPAEPNANEINPGATEVCDEVDNDCSGRVDDLPGGDICGEECAMPGAEDACGVDPALDGVGTCRAGTRTCGVDGTFGSCVGAVGPANETCDGADEDCDGSVDEEPTDGTSCYADTDGDGAGDPGDLVLTCGSCPSGWVENADDCNDGDASIYAGAPELCDLVDNDCSSGGGADPSEDADGDGYAGTGCAGGTRVDCDDSNAAVHPNQLEYFGLPTDCAPGETYIDGACCEPFPSTRCTFSAGSFDYDCDGEERPQPAVYCGCDPASRCGAIHVCSGPGLPCFRYAVGDEGPKVNDECGVPVEFAVCSGGCFSCADVGMSESRPQPCR